MGCRTCGGASATAVPGGTSTNPIILGEPDGRPAQAATFLQVHEQAQVGDYFFVAGSGVEAVVDAGVIVLGYAPGGVVQPAPSTLPEPEPTPQWYVRIGRNRWVGVQSKVEAERYARATGGEVVAYDDVMGG